MTDSRPDPPGEDPGELLRAFRWTQQVARRLVHDPALAADLQQETWTRALERFDGRAPARSWLVGTLRSLAFRSRRSHRRRRDHESRAARVDLTESAAQLIERSEAQQAVAAAVAELPRDLRIAMLLHFQEGLSLAEVAEHLGCAKSTAGDRVQRGVAELRKRLRADESSWKSCCVLALPLGHTALPLAAGAAAGTVVSTGSFVPSTLFGLAMKKVALAAVALAAFLLFLTASAVREEPEEVESATVDRATLAGVEESEEEAESALPQAVDSARAPHERVALSPVTGPPEESYVVLARVLDPNDDPVVKPRLSIHARDWRREAVGNADGTVQLHLVGEDLEALGDRSVTIEVCGDDYLTMWASYISRDGTSSLAPPVLGVREDLGTLRLSPAGAIQGRAVSTAGDPIVGAEIDIGKYDPEDPESNWAYEGSVPEIVTDQRGEFLLPHIKPGLVRIGLHHAESMVDPPRVVVEVRVGVTAGPVTLSATPAAIVTGRVVDKEGNPLAGAYVNGTGNWTYTDTDETDESGAFRIALRRGSPAEVKAYRPGWRQVRPTPGSLYSEGELEIVLESELPSAPHRVLVVDALSGDPVFRAGLSIQSAPELAMVEPSLVTQPAEGLPVELTLGSRLMVAGEGYEARTVTIDELPSTPPNLTVKLEPAVGIRGRLVEGGQPVVGARVKVASVWLHVARPRESLQGQRVVRDEPAEFNVQALTGSGGYSPESVLGLDGEPPGYRLNAAGAQHGVRTDEEGRFRLPPLDKPSAGLLVEVEGAPTRVLGTYALEDGNLDLGDVELEASASLTGRFRCSQEWDPTRYSLVVRQPRREVRLDEQGSFTIDGLQPGGTYFSLGLDGVDDIFAELGIGFVGLPEFHVELAPGEDRVVQVDLDPYTAGRLDLTLTIAGKAPTQPAGVLAVPVDQPDREFRLGGVFEGNQLTTATRSLGVCDLVLSMRGSSGGWVRMTLPGPPVELTAGTVATRTLDVPAGQLALTLTGSHSALEYDKLDLTLRGETEYPIQWIDSGPGVLPIGPIPPGTYQATLSPSARDRKQGAPEVLDTFEVEIRANETTEMER